MLEGWRQLGKSSDLGVSQIESFEVSPGRCVDEICADLPVGQDSGGGIGSVISKAVLGELACTGKSDAPKQVPVLPKELLRSW